MRGNQHFTTIKHLLLGMAALIAVLAGAGLLGGSVANAATTTVNVGAAGGAQVFVSNDITITTNDTVHFLWADGFHNATYASGPGSAWASPNLSASGQFFDHQFTTSGTYWYYCSIHAGAGDATPGNLSTKMVGRITVNNPAPDVTAPTVSAVAATPNPTDGAGSVALSATVTDTGTPATGVQSARYKVDGGAAVAMNLSGSTASASVPVGSLGLGPHTLTVEALDGASPPNVGSGSTTLSVTATPAGAVAASVTVVGGSLTNTANAVNLGSVTLNGTDQEKAATPTTPWNATDARGTGAGWNVTISCTDFSGSAGSIAVSNFRVDIAAAAIVPVGGNTPPTTQVPSAVPLSASPLKVLSAALTAGQGSYNYSPDFLLTVPASTPQGSYTANMTVTINSGP